MTEIIKGELKEDYKEIIIKNFEVAFDNRGRKNNPSALLTLVSAKVSV